MMADLAALTPPLVVCAAFIIGVVIFLRRQMAAKAVLDKAVLDADKTARELAQRAADPDGPADTNDL